MTAETISSSKVRDVVVIGGGPAGTTVATLLARRGRDVLLLEREQHPRFHIGESLLPHNLPIFDQLGIQEQVAGIGMLKLGAEVTPAGQVDPGPTFYFDNALNRGLPSAYQVRRSEFDALLFDNCVNAGVDARQKVRVRNVQLNDQGPHELDLVDAQGQQDRARARFVIDASGRHTVLARQLGLKNRHARHQTAAVFGHFRNVPRRSGRDEGNISLYWFEHGWFWMIPLRDGAMSVGAVCLPEYLRSRTCGVDDFLWQTIRLCPGVSARMQDAELIEPATATGNYSYVANRMRGPGWLLLGDAYCFVDPVFSSGVYVAMSSGVAAADAIDAWLADAPDAEQQLKAYELRTRRGLAAISWLIYRFTMPAMQRLFMAERETLRMRSAVTSILAGDFFGNPALKRPLFLFKTLYYATCWLDLLKNLGETWRRRRNLFTRLGPEQVSEPR